MISWLFSKFWRAAPTFGYESAWNAEQDADAWEGVRYELERIANVLERWERMR
tara:strand:- start:240 stop:398 length:159 start_codon:yes stop_codon:yes gene_type:complete